MEDCTVTVVYYSSINLRNLKPYPFINTLCVQLMYQLHLQCLSCETLDNVGICLPVKIEIMAGGLHLRRDGGHFLVAEENAKLSTHRCDGTHKPSTIAMNAMNLRFSRGVLAGLKKVMCPCQSAKTPVVMLCRAIDAGKRFFMSNTGNYGAGPPSAISGHQQQNIWSFGKMGFFK